MAMMTFLETNKIRSEQALQMMMFMTIGEDLRRRFQSEFWQMICWSGFSIRNSVATAVIRLTCI